MQHELKLRRIWVEADDILGTTLRYNKLSLHPADIHYFEEYVGSGLSEFTEEPVTAVHLYHQEETLFLAMEFEVLYKQMEKYRSLRAKEGIFNRN
jgi:hypothetical protein